MAEAAEYELVEVTVPVTVRVPVTGLEELEDTLERAWRVAGGLEAHPLEHADEHEWGVTIHAPTHEGAAVLVDAGGSLLEELQ